MEARVAVAEAVEQRAQADLAGGQVYFSHDGSQGAKAHFDVEVTDASGASSGPAKTVNVAVRA